MKPGVYSPLTPSAGAGISGTGAELNEGIPDKSPVRRQVDIYSDCIKIGFKRLLAVAGQGQQMVFHGVPQFRGGTPIKSIPGHPHDEQHRGKCSDGEAGTIGLD